MQQMEGGGGRDDGKANVRHKPGNRDSREEEWSEEAELISYSQRQRGIYCRAQGEGKGRRKEGAGD